MVRCAALIDVLQLFNLIMPPSLPSTLPDALSRSRVVFSLRQRVGGDLVPIAARCVAPLSHFANCEKDRVTGAQGRQVWRMLLHSKF